MQENEPVKQKRIEYNLEALRGGAALIVVLYHIIFFDQYLDPNYFPVVIKVLQFPGHLSVLVFFVLSGFVIGISNQQSLTIKTILPYLKKRFIRLYPIYFLSLVFTLLVAPVNYSLYTIGSNFTLTQGVVAPVIWENCPIWSLHYEALYYLIFIPVSLFRMKLIFVFFASLILGLANYFFYPYLNTPIITSYAFGFIFWIAGLFISKYFTEKEAVTNYKLLVSNLFLFISLVYYNVFASIFNRIVLVLFKHNIAFSENINWAKKIILFSDLSYLPYCVLSVLLFSNRQFKYKKIIVICMQILPAYTLFFIFKSIQVINVAEIIVSTICYIISLFLFFIKAEYLSFLSKKIIHCGIWLGSISYGIYIIHFPILVIFKQIFVFSGSLFSFLVRLGAFLFLTVVSSFMLEKRFQPWIKKLIG